MRTILSPTRHPQPERAHTSQHSPVCRLGHVHRYPSKCQPAAIVEMVAFNKDGKACHSVLARVN
eukprot:1145909-Pelagomonas_calceolata.AAC.6